jgi:hypothetical protein
LEVDYLLETNRNPSITRPGYFLDWARRVNRFWEEEWGGVPHDEVPPELATQWRKLDMHVEEARRLLQMLDVQ